MNIKLFSSIEDSLNNVGAADIEILTANELDAVCGGGPFSEATTGTVSFCSTDGTDEPD